MNYAVTRKELLAIVYFIKHFSYFLRGRNFLVRTDHAALQWLLKTKNIHGQLMRWSEELQGFNFAIEYRAGKKHGNADALSRYRHPDKEEDGSEPTPEDIRMHQELGIALPKEIRGRAKAVQVLTRSQARRKPTEVEAESGERAKQPEGSTKPDGQDLRSQPEPVSSKSGVQISTGETKDDEREGEEGEALQPNEDKPEPSYDCLCGPKNAHERAVEEMVALDEEDGTEWARGPPGRQIMLPNLAEEQKKDPHLAQVRKWLNQAQCPVEVGHPYLKRFKQNWDYLRMKEDKLYLFDPEQERLRLCVPNAVVPNLLRSLHVHPLAGHVGRTRTYKQARLHFYWPNMHEHIRRAIDGCVACKRAKARKPRLQVPMGQTSSGADERFRIFYADIVGPWPSTRAANSQKYLLTIQDATTKYPEAFVLNRITAERVTQVLIDEFFPRYGVGMKIVTDRGRQFVSSLFKHVCGSLGVATAVTQAYEPHSNPVERMHRTIEGHIRACMEQEEAHPNQWFRYVSPALAAMRQTPLTEIGVSPHYLVTGDHPVIPAQVYVQDHKNPANPATNVEASLWRLQKSLERVREQQLATFIKNKRRYDTKLKESPIKVGDWIFKFTPIDTSESGLSRKTAAFQEGPFRVVDIPNDRQVKIVKSIFVNNQGQVRTTMETISRDRATKADKWDLCRLPSPMSWQVGKRFKTPRALKFKPNRDEARSDFDEQQFHQWISPTRVKVWTPWTPGEPEVQECSPSPRKDEDPEQGPRERSPSPLEEEETKTESPCSLEWDHEGEVFPEGEMFSDEQGSRTGSEVMEEVEPGRSNAKRARSETSEDGDHEITTNEIARESANKRVRRREDEPVTESENTQIDD